MFKITTWTSKKRTLDFSSSGQRNIDVLGIYIEGDVFCNAHELFEWDKDDDSAQFKICEACGIIQCEPGNWATFRKIEDIVIVIPIFRKILGKDEFERSEFTPPHIIRKRGIVYFDADVYQKFQSEFPKFPKYENIPILKQYEALRAIQHDAPGRFLGDIYKSIEPNVVLSPILAASDGNPEDFTKILLRLYGNPIECDDPAKVSKPSKDDTMVSLFLDLPQMPEWNAFWVRENIVSLYFSPGLKLELNCNSEQGLAQGRGKERRSL